MARVKFGVICQSIIPCLVLHFSQIVIEHKTQNTLVDWYLTEIKTRKSSKVAKTLSLGNKTLPV